MTSSLSRNMDHSKNRMIPPRSDKVGKRILISGTFLPLKRKFFKVIEDYTETFDFLIMKNYTRTFKALLAILRGIPIVSSEWVRDSENIGSILKVESYYFEDIETIYESIDKGSKGDKIFEGFYFYLASQEYHMEK